MQIDWNIVGQIAVVLLGIVASHFGLKLGQNSLHAKVDALAGPCPDCGSPKRSTKPKGKK